MADDDGQVRKVPTSDIPRAGHIEQSLLSVVDIVRFRFVGGIGYALVDGQNALIAATHGWPLPGKSITRHAAGWR